MPARYAHWSPWRKAVFAPATIWLWIAGGYRAAVSAALANDFVSSAWVLLETSFRSPRSACRRLPHTLP
jgi:hypothetical protein